MDRYSVLVVDDSAVMRKAISTIIEACPSFYVIGRARNGVDAIEKVKRLKPSIVILDIEMPILDGLEALKTLMNDMPLPIIMLSNDVDATVKAFKLGAVDFVVKHQLITQNNEAQREDFYKRLHSAVATKFPEPIIRELDSSCEIEQQPTIKKMSGKELLIIGSSTGGPAALQSILTKFPTTICVPILIVQHMPPGFTKSLAERFNRLCHVHVKEAEHNEILAAGTIYIAPAGVQTTLTKLDNGMYVVKQNTTTYVETLYKPSIDVTLLSVTEAAKAALLTVILTGMGDDGLRGCKAVKKFGGTVIAEAEETCIVYGMPKVVFEAGLVDKQLPLPNIFDEIMTII